MSDKWKEWLKKKEDKESWGRSPEENQNDVAKPFRDEEADMSEEEKQKLQDEALKRIKKKSLLD
jgi:hypothetical protein